MLCRRFAAILCRYLIIRSNWPSALTHNGTPHTEILHDQSTIQVYTILCLLEELYAHARRLKC